MINHQIFFRAQTPAISKSHLRTESISTPLDLAGSCPRSESIDFQGRPVGQKPLVF